MLFFGLVRTLTPHSLVLGLDSVFTATTAEYTRMAEFVKYTAGPRFNGQKISVLKEKFINFFLNS
jgi:hypothetical protein